MAAHPKGRVDFYKLQIYVRREAGEWVAYVHPFSVAGEGSTQKKAVEAALANLAELLRELRAEAKRHGDHAVEVLCPLKQEYKKGAKTTLVGFLVACTGPIKQWAMWTAPRAKTLSKAKAREMVATSATMGAFSPFCFA